MKVFKFGGSVLKDSNSILSATQIVLNECNDSDIKVKHSKNNLSIENNEETLLAFKKNNNIEDEKLDLSSPFSEDIGDKEHIFTFNSNLKRNNFPRNKLIIVISAIDKTTRILESIYFIREQRRNQKNYHIFSDEVEKSKKEIRFSKNLILLNEFNSLKDNQIKLLLNKFYDSHIKCIDKLVPELYKKAEIEIKDYIIKIIDIINSKKAEIVEIDSLFSEVKMSLKDKKESKVPITKNKTLNLYAKIVSIGELISSKIFYFYLLQSKLNCKIVNASKLIKTDLNFENANINLNQTKSSINDILIPILNNHDIIITQGFIGSNINNQTTTLGKEGSDYSATLIGSIMNVNSIILWKDIEGLMNADPKIFADALKIEEISYDEASEMAFYGSKVIHYKTLAPLLNTKIPLFIKSFFHPSKSGTKICKEAKKVDKKIYILKKNQLLITLNLPDYLLERDHILISNNVYQPQYNLEYKFDHVLNLFKSLNINISLTEKYAKTLFICVDQKDFNYKEFQNLFKDDFFIKYDNNLSILISKNLSLDDDLPKIIKGKKIFLKQMNKPIIKIIFSDS